MTGRATKRAISATEPNEGDSDAVRISWPTTEGFRLQFSPTLGAGAQWTDAGATVQNNGGTTSAEVDIIGQNGFYRLIK